MQLTTSIDIFQGGNASLAARVVIDVSSTVRKYVNILVRDLIRMGYKMT